MIVVDASCLGEILVGGADAQLVSERIARDPDHAAPHIIDVEVLGLIRHH